MGTIFKHQIYAQHLLLCIIMGPKPFRRTILFFVWVFKLGNQKEACLLLGQSFTFQVHTTKTQINLVLFLLLCILIISAFLLKNPNFEGLFHIFMAEMNTTKLEFQYIVVSALKITSRWCCKWVIIFLKSKAFEFS